MHVTNKREKKKMFARVCIFISSGGGPGRSLMAVQIIGGEPALCRRSLAKGIAAPLAVACCCLLCLLGFSVPAAAYWRPLLPAGARCCLLGLACGSPGNLNFIDIIVVMNPMTSQQALARGGEEAVRRFLLNCCRYRLTTC